MCQKERELRIKNFLGITKAKEGLQRNVVDRFRFANTNSEHFQYDKVFLTKTELKTITMCFKHDMT